MGQLLSGLPHFQFLTEYFEYKDYLCNQMTNKEEIVKRARQLTKRGYSVIPVDKLKNPVVNSWNTWQSRPMTEDEIEKYFVKNSKVEGVALLAGGEKAVTILDMDLKNDLTGTLYDRILEVVPASIFKKVMVNKTVSGGIHWILSCPKGVSNIKLAQRETTDEEVMETYNQHIEDGVGAKKSMAFAMGDKVRVLLETRSFTSVIDKNGVETRRASGYGLFPPSPGYEHIEGKLGKLTVEELDNLLTILRSFNEYCPDKYNLKSTTSLGNDIWEAANNKLDSVELLKEVGWTVIWENDKDVRLLRPGRVSSTTSGIYHRDTKVFVCFSSSTVFECNKGYSPAQVFIELEDGDIKQAKEKLLEMLKLIPVNES